MDSQIAPQQQHHQGVEGEEDGQHHEKQSVLMKVKAKAKKIKDNITKHGAHDHPHDYDDDDEEDDEVLQDSVYEGAAMRGGVGGERQHEGVGIGMPPPGPRETTSHPAAVTTLFTSVDNSADASNTTMSLSPSKLEEDPHAPKNKTHLHPRNSEVKVHDPASTGSEEAGESQILDSFAKMEVNDEQNQSRDQVSYAQKISAVGSAVSGKAVAAKDFVASKIALTVTEKLKPGEEDRALSEVISEALNRRKQEVVKVGESAFREPPKGSATESGRSVVGVVKDTVGSWLGKAGGQSAGQGRPGKDHGGTEAEVRILQESAN
ncbi:low-temperature-induced 65 kDa protein-like [Cucurbita pepo subsp. pepo]|uniref:low-temperature-induced 65 kDa protein-like n=1 Tax=Cucurbita pepo subsp. pepo TaxID=3664 RepID=UPI000C9D9402|nr:low-temperature-induced 65 kDa protein-like [Cucurbita pepo subsp. pepo]